MELPTVSIIIPNYNNSLSLKRCLQASTSQSYPSHLYDIIVVDNGSSDGFLEISSQFPSVSFHLVAGPKSPYICRNKAALLSTADVLAFTDSNSFPANDWLENGIRGLLHTKSKIAAGMIKFLHSEPIKAGEILEILTFPSLQQIRASGQTATAKNLVMYKSLFEEIGAFLSVRSNGDSEFIRRAYQHGYKTTIIDNAVVYYQVQNLIKTLNKQFRLGRGNIEIARLENNFLPAKWLFKTFREMRPPSLKYVSNLVKEKGTEYGFENRISIYFHLWFARLFKGVGRLNALLHLDSR